MSGLTDYTAENLLNYLTGRTAMPTLPTAYVVLFNIAPTSDAAFTGATEVSGLGYTRLLAASGNWGAAQASSGSEPSVVPAFIQNSATLTFQTASGNWGTVVAFGIADASGTSGGNLLAWDYLGNYLWYPVTMTAVTGSPGGVVTHPSNAYANGVTVVVTTKYGGTLPTATGGTTFTGLLTVTGWSSTGYTLLTSGATALLTATSGDFQIRQVTQQSIPSGVTASFSPSGLVLSSA